MKRRYYRLLSGILSASMLFSEIVPMTTNAAPTVQEAEAEDGFTEETEDAVEEEPSETEEETEEAVTAEAEDDDDAEAEETEETVEAEEAEEAVEIEEEEEPETDVYEAEEEETAGADSVSDEDIIETEEEEGAFTLSANVTPKAYHAEAEITLSGDDIEDLKVYLIWKYGTGFTTAEKASEEDLNSYYRMEEIELEGTGTHTVLFPGKKSLSASSTYQYRLAVRNEEEEYVFMTPVDSFTTMKGVSFGGMDVSASSYSALFKPTLSCEPADDNYPPELYVLYTADATASFPASIDEESLPKGFSLYNIEEEEALIYKLEPSTTYRYRVLWLYDELSYMTDEVFSFTTKEGYKANTSVTASAYSAKIKASFPRSYEYNWLWEDDERPLYLVYGKVSENAPSGRSSFITYDSAENMNLVELGALGDQDKRSITLGGVDEPLDPATKYRYCFAVNYETDESSYLLRITDATEFTTAAAVNETKVSPTVTIEKSGYYAEKAVINFNNPGNEEILEVFICSENKADTGVEVSRWSDNEAEAYVPFGAYDKLYVAYKVLVGAKPQPKVYTVPLELKTQDISARKISVVSKNSVTNLWITASVEPYYEIDDCFFKLYYRKKGETEYNSLGTGWYDDETHKFLTISLGGLSDNCEYEYYVVMVGSYLKDDEPVYGSAEAPVSFTTGTTVTYKEEDFADKGLFLNLTEKGFKCTNAEFEGMTTLTIEGIAGGTPIKVLDDIADKFPNLEYMSIKDNDITDVTPLLEMKKLKEVHLDYNDIATLPDLSGTGWTEFSINGNLINDDDAENVKLPASMKIYSHSVRDDAPDVYVKAYKDNNGKMPLIFYPGKMKIRNYTVSVNVAGKKRSCASLLDAEMLSAWRSNNKFYWNEEYDFLQVCDDFGNRMGLEAGQSYKVTIKLTDDFGKETEYDYDISWSETGEQLESAGYLEYDADSFYFNVWLPSAKENASVSANLQKNGAAVSSTGSAKVYRQDRFSRFYKLNKWANNYGDNYGLDYNCGRASFNLSIDRMLEDGKYDVVLSFADGTKKVFEGAAVVSDGAVITYCDLGDEDYSIYDNTGSDYYINLCGYNLEKGMTLQIAGTDGTVYTEFGEIVRTSSSDDGDGYSYYVRLKKKANWNSIKSGADYVLRANGAYTDPNGILPMTINGSSLITKKTVRDYEEESLRLLGMYYNQKSEEFVCRLEKRFAGRTLRARLWSASYYDPEKDDEINEEYEDKNISGSAVVDADGIARFSLPGFTPKDGWYLGISVWIDGTEMYADFEDGFRVRYYNYSAEGSDPVTPAKRSMWILIDRNTYMKGESSISFRTEGVSANHSTEDLYAKLIVDEDGDDGGTVSSCSLYRAYAGEDGSESYTVSGNWTVNLDYGKYRLVVFEKADGKDRELCRTTLYVRNSLLLQREQNVRWDNRDLTKAILDISLPAYANGSYDDAAVAKFVSENKLSVEIYGKDKSKASGVSAEAAGFSEGYLSWKLSGLDKNAKGYFFRVLSDGKPLTAYYGSEESWYRYSYDDEEYTGVSYEDADKYGKWAARRRDFYFEEDSSRQNAYTAVYINDAFGKAPYTMSFYSFTDRYTSLSRTEIAAAGYYKLTPADVRYLAADTLYTCIISDCDGNMQSATGYFASGAEFDKAVESVNVKSVKPLYVGESAQLKAEVIPYDAVNRAVSYSSSDEDIVTVSRTGMITAKGLGKAEITVTAVGGSKDTKPAVVTVNVIDKENELYVVFKDDDAPVYTGSRLTPEVIVYYGDRVLVKDVDYKLSYSSNTNAGNKASVKVTGITVAGNVTKNFAIAPRNIDETVSATPAAASLKNNNIILYFGNIKLKSSKEFDVKEIKDQGDHFEVTVEGKLNFTGTYTFRVEKITKAEAIKVSNFKANARTYNGKPQPLTPGELTVVDSKKNVLTENEDYMIVYPEDITSAGTVYFTIIGLGKYKAAIRKSYKIEPDKSANAEVRFADGSDELTMPYDPNGVYANVIVTCGGKELKAGKDYKLKYKNNKQVSTNKKAEVTVEFTGDYKGHAKVTKEYTIEKVSLKKAEVIVPDLGYIGSAKYNSTPYVMLGDTLVDNKEYDVEYEAAGSDITKRKVTDADMAASPVLTVKVTVTAKNKNYKDSVTGSYTITKTDKDHCLQKASAKACHKNGKTFSTFNYTGSPCVLGEDDILMVKLGEVVLEPEDYSVTYVNNVNKGKASIIVTAKPGSGYAGSRVLNMSIAKGTLNFY